jgi:hypothetical protein
MERHSLPPKIIDLLNPGDKHIASGLNTTHKNDAVLFVRFTDMSRAHGFEGKPSA